MRQQPKATVTGHDFIKVINTAIDADIRCGHFGQASKIISIRNSLQRFLSTQGLIGIDISLLTQPLIKAYQDWLHQQGITRNSSSCYMRTLQSIYNQAIRNIHINDLHPFDIVYKGVAKTRKRATTIDIIRRLQTLNLHDALTQNGKKPQYKTFHTQLQNLTLARDLFIFSYCSRGMALIDMAYLRKSDMRHNIIRYKRQKTGQELEISVNPIMCDIINRYANRTRHTPYLLPIISHTDPQTAYRQYRSALRNYNHHLKALANMLGPHVHLSSYVARHSWASHMYQQARPIAIISQGLGHQSVSTTQIYIKSLEDSLIHKANNEFLNEIFTTPFLTAEREDLS